MTRLTPCALLALIVSCFSQAVAGPLSVQFKNDSGRLDSEVYIGFIGTSGLNATNASNGQSLSISSFGNEHWYTLDTLPKGINLSNFSGRVYVGYGTPWTIGGPGYEPSPVSPSDPNYLKRYDKFEITYNGNAADVANTTSIDYFSIPLQLDVYQGGIHGTNKGTLTASPANVTLNAVRALTTPHDAAVVRNGGEFVRVIGPNAYPPSPGLPASPYDNFNSYLSYLHDGYAPAHGGTFATIKGHFNGVGVGPTPQTKAQDYNFIATIDAEKNITLTGSATDIGSHTLLFKYVDLMNPTGIYGANPTFYLDGTMMTPQNDIYGWMIGDLLAGLNIGAIGSTVLSGGIEVGQMISEEWFTLDHLFAGLQPNHPEFYNQWAASMTTVSEAYNFAYSDRFAHVVAPLNPAVVDTLQVTFVGSAAIPEASSMTLLFAGGCLLAGGWVIRMRTNSVQR